MPLIKLPKLPAFIGFQYLYFPRSLPITFCVHFVLTSKLPPRCPSTTCCTAFILLQYSRCPWATSCIHLVLYLFPPWPPKVPPTCAPQQLPAFMPFQYLSFPPFVSPQLLACTVIWAQYLDFCFSSQQLLAFILVSMSNFPLSHLPRSHQFSAVTWLQYLHVPPFLSTPSCMHLVSISKFPPPCARSKKTCTSSKKKAPRPKNIQPNVSAYTNGVSPSTLWRQGPRSRCTGPKNRNRAQKQLTWPSEKKNPGPSTNTCRSKKNYPHRVQKTHRQVPHIFMTLGPKKKIRLGPKNMYRSKKKSAQVQKTCIPKTKTERRPVGPWPWSHQKPSGWAMAQLARFLGHSNVKRCEKY